MQVIFNGKKWQSGKWQNVKYCTVKNKNNSLYDYLQQNIKNGNFLPDEKTVQYFNIDGIKITYDDLYNRFGMLGFDFKCENYPSQINCYTNVKSIYNPVYCELNESGEKLRIWKAKTRT